MVPFLKRLLLLQIRRRRRYKTRDGVYVIYEQSMLKNQLDTISMGGLSFYYVDNGHKIDKGSYALAVFTDNNMRLTNVPFKTVSDVETGEILFRKKRIKRQSVQFEQMTGRQKDKLRQIIDSYALR